ncbi:MAG: hypothetical protein M8353_12230, partial [ANME-2 cluster archaeon]|nr:hypothetical protein [ANME-2 cluster archaeon]
MTDTILPEINTSNFAGFYYDFKNDRGTEKMTVVMTAGSRLVGLNNLIYSTSIMNVNYSSTNLEYAGNVDFKMIGYLAEEYVPISADASKLSKLLVDDKQSHTIRTGQVYELGEGYAVTAQQVDVDGKKVWLELTKNGEYVADKIIEVASTAPYTANVWIYDQDIAGETDVVTLKLFVEQVFQGQVDSLAVIKGIWQISDTAMEVKTDDKVGKLKVTNIGTDTITMKNADSSFTLTQNTDVKITPDLAFRVADSTADIRFYLMKEYTAPGTYEIRGTARMIVANSSAAGGANVSTWDADSFAGFFYDLKNNKKYESLTINSGDYVSPIDTNNRSIAESALVYTAQIKSANYSSTNLEYAGTVDFNKIGYLAEEYVPISADASKLSKLLVDDKQSHTIRTGQVYELGEGYAVTAQQVDVDGKKVWLELTKNGEYVADKIIEV